MRWVDAWLIRYGNDLEKGCRTNHKIRLYFLMQFPFSLVPVSQCVLTTTNKHTNKTINPLQRFDYSDRIATAIDDYDHKSRSLSIEGWGCPRVQINMSELRSQSNGQLSQRLRRDPLRHLRALEVACHEIAEEVRPGYDKTGKDEIRLIFSSRLQRKSITCRGLKKHFHPIYSPPSYCFSQVSESKLHCPVRWEQQL